MSAQLHLCIANDPTLWYIRRLKWGFSAGSCVQEGGRFSDPNLVPENPSTYPAKAASM